MKPSTVPGNTPTVFADSIQRVIRLNESNSYINKRYAKAKSFPGAPSKELLHYIEPTLRNIALKCRSFGITKVYISGVVVNDTMSDSLLESINTKISEMCRESSCAFADNRNIQTVHL